jgi:AcrR family transcriptional regulator
MTRALRRDDLRADVLQNAAAPIARHGYHGMSMRDLAKATGKSLASFYHLFQSKEDILFEIQSQAFERLISTAERALAEVRDPVGQLQIFVLNHVRYFDEQPDVMRVLVHEAAALPKSRRASIRALKQRYFEIAREIVREIVARDSVVDALEIERMTYSVFGMLNWIYAWYEPARHGPPEQLARTIEELALHGIDTRVPTDASWSTVVSALDGIERLPLLRGADTGGSR